MYKNEKGSVLLAALMLIILLSVIGLSSLRQVDIETTSSSNQRASVQAFYLAEAGLQRAVAKLKTDSSWAATVAGQANAFDGDNRLGNGTYVVQVFADDPEVGSLRVQSTGYANGYFDSASTVEVVGTGGSAGSYPPLFDFAHFVCGNMHMGGHNTMINGDVFSGGDATLEGEGLNRVTGDFQVRGNFTLRDSGNIVGNLSGNSNVKLESTHSPNVDGDVQAAGNLTAGSNGASGSMQAKVSPAPVPDLCSDTQLAETAITAQELDDFESQADQVVSGDLTIENETTSLSGIVVVENDLHLNGDIILEDDLIFIVKGNIHLAAPGSIRSDPEAKRITLIVRGSGNIHINGGSQFEVDGQIQVGEAVVGGKATGGNVHVEDDSRLIVNGSLGLLAGNLHMNGVSTMQVSWERPGDSRLMIRGDQTQSAGFTLKRWKRVSN